MIRKHILTAAFILFVILIMPVFAITYDRIDAPEFDITYLDRIAVLPFEPGLESLFEGEMVADRLATHLAQEGFLNLIERMQVEKVLQEGSFSREDFADSTAAAGFGKLLGADAIIIGRIDTKYSEKADNTYVWKEKKYLVWENGKQVEKTKSEQVQVPILLKTGEVNLDTKVVEVETGRIIASKVAYYNWEKRGVDNQEINALPPQSALLEDCLARCMDILLRAYTPHKVVIERELRPKSHAKTDELKGKEFAESGFYAEAAEIFEKIIAEEPAKNDIRGNLAIVYEALGDFEKADKVLEEAIRYSIELKRKTVHPLTEYRNSMQQAWYYTKRDTLAKKPVIVLKVDGDKVFIDAGSIRQIKVGDKFKVSRETVIVHPVTGETMGSDKREIALIEIIEVQEKMSIAKIVITYRDDLEIQALDVAINIEKDNL
ncbi:MAG: tetratricopeptide repeat protein [bacterium]